MFTLKEHIAELKRDIKDRNRFRRFMRRQERQRRRDYFRALKERREQGSAS